MKKTLAFLSFLLIFSCESDGINADCDIITSQTLNLANSEFIDLLVPGGSAYTDGGPKGLIVYNFGTYYKAFSRECPNDTCSDKMNKEGSLKIKCPCDDAEYSIIDGSPQTSGVNVSVCEFKVTKLSSSILRVSNY